MRNQVFKKLFSALLALIMVAGLLPASVLAEGWTAADVDSTPAPAETVQPTESAEPTEPAETETPGVTEVPEPTPENPATMDEPTAEPAEGEEPAEPAEEETPAPEDSILLAAENVTARDTSKDDFYRIVHLDCGREYFSKAWIIALINEMAAAGYNQLQLAFGNGGFRFYLDDMSVDAYSDEAVRSALEYGNNQYNKNGDTDQWVAYNPKKNALTESEMDDIIAYAQSKGIEIVPMLNTPGHMHAVLAAMQNLGISGTLQVSGKPGCLNLENTVAVSFTKELVSKYVKFFADNGCNFFNAAMDEYSSWENVFYNYANDIISIITGNNMTPRMFNDALRSNNTISNSNVQVCYWFYGNDCYQVGQITQYQLINANHDYYYVSTNENWNLYSEEYTFVGEYNEDTWINKAKQFNNNTFNHGRGVGITVNSPVGSMFCIWCNTPGKQNETTIAQQIRMILRVIGARMQDNDNYSASDVLVEGGFKADGTINVTADKVYSGTGTTEASENKKADEVIVSAAGLKTLTATKVTENLPAIEDAAENKIVAYDVTPYTDNKTTKHTDKATVSIAIPEGWDTNKVRGFVVESGDSAKGNITTIEGKVEDGYYTFTALHFSVMGIYEQAVTYVEKTVTVVVDGSETVTVDGKQGEEVENGELLTEDGTTVIANYKVKHVSKTGGTTRTVADEVTLSGLDNGKTADVLIGDWQAQDNPKRPSNYMVVANGAISSTTNVNDATVFTVTKVNNYYTIKVKDDNKYIIRNNSGLSIGTSASQNNSWSVGTGNDLYYYYQSGRNYNYYYLTYSNANNQWGVSNSIGDWQTVAHPYSFKTETTQAEEKTEITFTGVAEGTTSVVIGGTRYTVEVKAKELGDAKLYVDFWVTSNRVKPNNLDVVSAASIFNEVSTKDKRYYHEFTAAYSTFASEEGVLLTDLIPSGGEYTNTTDTTGTTGTTNTIDAMLWKVRYLPQAYRQTAAGWTNKSGFGTDTVTGKNGGVDIERIRYYENKWQYKAVGGTDWGEFTTSMDESGDQIAAYYLLKTEVTTQVTTYITDWPDPQTKEFYGVALDYCVKYESDSTRNPNTFGKATNNKNTQWFNCVGESSGDPIDNGYTLASTDNSIGDWKGNGSNEWYRVINNIRAVETDKYEIYMVTATPSNKFSSEGNQACPDSITYPEEGEKVIWAENEDVVSTSGLTAHGEIKYGGTPDINRVVIQQCTGMLITYYVRAKANASLTVHYIDDTAGGTEFYKYGIDVDSNTLFSKNIDFVDGVLNSYTVKNNDGDTQKIESDLQRMPKIDAQYRYSKYKCVSVRRSDDGKDFYLHYTFDNKVTFVVDFGLPLKVTPAEVNKELSGKAKSVNVTQKNVKYGTVTVDGADFTYTLNKMINGYEMIVAEYSGVNTETNTEGKVAYNVYIIPATTVYYEDSFAKFYGADKAEQKEFDASSDKDEAGVWYIDGETATVDQALEALGQENHNPYGYDPAYNNCTMFSMGSARKVTVTSEMANNWDNTTSAWPTAQFTFKGTGFDIISMTDNTSGAIFVDVVNAETGAKAKSVFVDNYYGYTYNETNGWQPSTNNEPNALYQIPVIAVRGLEYAEYNVVIKVAYNTFFDHTTPKGSYSFWLDAVRVYNPAGNELDTEYGKDSEAKPVYTEVRKALIGQGNFVSNDATNVEGAVFIDGKATGATIEDYTNYGPNHEVYLAQGQAIAFKIVADSEPKTVQLGVKLANGERGTLNIGGDGIKFAAYNNKEAANSLTLGTATDMYYALTGLTWSNSTGSEKGEMVSNLIVLTNNSANIISITNVKCTFEAAQEAETNTVALAISYDDALMAVSMVNNLLAPEPEPEPEKTFEPERFEASWTKNVMQGRKATLTVKTSEDVEAITVDGQTIRSYRTRTERVGFGRYAKRVTYREFTYSMVAQESADFSVTAINAEGTESEAITARLTVQKRPESIRDIWNWFKGWF